MRHRWDAGETPVLEPSGSPPARLGLRAFCAARAAFGLLLVSRPGPVLRAAGERDPLPRPAVVGARVLACRDIAQALVTAAVPDRGLLRAGAFADVLHAASMAALAARSRRYRGPALVSGTLATLEALGGLLFAASVSGRAEPA